MLRGKGCQSNGGRFYLLEALRVLAEGPGKRRRRIACGRGCSKPKREAAIRQAREVQRMRLVTRLPAMPYPMNQEQGKNGARPEISAREHVCSPEARLAISWRFVSSHWNAYPQQKRFQLASEHEVLRLSLILDALLPVMLLAQARFFCGPNHPSYVRSVAERER